MQPYANADELKGYVRQWLECENEEVQEHGGMLPSGWQSRRDNNGRTFYINHETRRTQWERPREQSPFELPEDNTENTSESTPSHTANIEAFQSRRITSIQDVDQWLGHHEEEAAHIQEIINLTPVGELDEPFSLAREEVTVNDSPTAPALNDLPYQEPYRETERRSSEPLPPGWTMKITSEGRPFFINHTTKTTSWTDPRTRDSSAATNASAPEPPRQASEGLGPLPEGWVEKTLPNGRMFFVDHINQKTTWEDPRFSNPEVAGREVVYSRDYKAKYDRFMRKWRLWAPKLTNWN